MLTSQSQFDLKTAWCCMTCFFNPVSKLIKHFVFLASWWSLYNAMFSVSISHIHSSDGKANIIQKQKGKWIGATKYDWSWGFYLLQNPSSLKWIAWLKSYFWYVIFKFKHDMTIQAQLWFQLNQLNSRKNLISNTGIDQMNHFSR